MRLCFCVLFVNSSCSEAEKGFGEPLPPNNRCVCVCVYVCFRWCRVLNGAHPLIPAVELQIYKAKRDLTMIPTLSVRDREAQFWGRILSRELKPVTLRLQQTSREIGQKLKDLRNSTLAIMLLVNIMWIILLYTVTLPQLVKYELPERAFQLLFLAVYGFIILVSFFAMLAHRFLMLIHFLGRPEVIKEGVRSEQEDVIVLETFTRSERS